MKSSYLSKGLVLCAVVITAFCFALSIFIFTTKSEASLNERVVTHINELNLDLTGDRPAQKGSDYTLVTTDTPYNLDLLTDNWEISGTSSNPVLLALPNGGTFSTNGLNLGSGSSINYKGNVELTIPSGTELIIDTMTMTSDDANIVLSGSGKFKAREVKTNKFTIDGPEVYIINNSESDYYALRLGGGNSEGGLYLKSGKLVCELNPGFEGISTGILSATGILKISNGAELFASGQSFGILFSVLPTSLSGAFTGSVDYLTYENRFAASSGLEIASQDNLCYFTIGGDSNKIAKSVRGLVVAPAPVPEPVVSETAQTGDDMSAVVALCIIAIAGSGGYVLSRRFRKN